MPITSNLMQNTVRMPVVLSCAAYMVLLCRETCGGTISQPVFQNSQHQHSADTWQPTVAS